MLCSKLFFGLIRAGTTKTKVTLNQFWICLPIANKNSLFASPKNTAIVYIWLLWGKPGSLYKPEVNRISSVKGNLFIFGLVCYIRPGSQKINILTAQYKRMSNKQAVWLQQRRLFVFCRIIIVSYNREIYFRKNQDPLFSLIKKLHNN